MLTEACLFCRTSLTASSYTSSFSNVLKACFFCTLKISSLYSGSLWDLIKLMTLSISSSETRPPCALMGFSVPGSKNNKSPLPRSLSAPFMSRTVLESTFVATLKDMRAGKFAFITPVITSTDGLCVARTICMPTALESWASRVIALSMSVCATSIKSASSSMITTIYGIKSCCSSSFPAFNFSLYILIFLTPASAKTL